MRALPQTHPNIHPKGQVNIMIKAYMSGFVSEPRKSSGLAFRRSQRNAEFADNVGIDVELINPGNHNGTIELEEQRKMGGSKVRPDPEQLTFGEVDFRELLDAEMDEASGIFCSCDMRGVKFCPLCNHPDLKDGEICICNMPIAEYERLVFKNPRKATAYDDNGQPLSPDYCAVIISLAEARDLCVKAGLSQYLFER